MEYDFDLLVVGAGPGGYVAAIKAAQLGLRTAVVDKAEAGGVCLNWGCIPSKNLISQAEKLQAVDSLTTLGAQVDLSNLNYKTVHKQSRKVTKVLSGGVKFLLKKNKVEFIQAKAMLSDKDQLTLDDGRILHAKNILVATGSSPMSVPGFEFDEETVLSSNGILAMDSLPESLIILGAGAIGCEFAYVMNSFGVKVTLVEAADHILPSEDSDSCKVLHQSLKKSGVDILVSTRAQGLDKHEGRVTVRVAAADSESSIAEDQRDINAEKVLVVFGRVPNTQSLGLEAIGVEVDERGFVNVSTNNRTNISGVYAIGDITTTPALAHVASKEGVLAVEHMVGKSHDETIDLQGIPSAIYTQPQIAGFGLRENEAKAKRIEYKKSVFPIRACGKAVAVGKTEGHVKILAHPQTNEILGAHIVGYDATEIIHELLLIRHAGLNPESVGDMIHAHPTISESIVEALHGLSGEMIHS